MQCKIVGFVLFLLEAAASLDEMCGEKGEQEKHAFPKKLLLQHIIGKHLLVRLLVFYHII